MPDRPGPAPEPVDTAREQQATEPLTLKDSFGTAVGAAMLGFEQALRDEPPPQIQAAEHMPDQRTVPGNDDFELRFPDMRRESEED